MSSNFQIWNACGSMSIFYLSSFPNYLLFFFSFSNCVVLSPVYMVNLIHWCGYENLWRLQTVFSFSREDWFVFKQAARIGADHFNPINNWGDSGFILVFVRPDLFWFALISGACRSAFSAEILGCYWPWTPTCAFLILWSSKDCCLFA